MALNRRSGSSNDENRDIAAIIAQQVKNVLPQIVTQVTNNVNNAYANGGNGRNGRNNGCSYKTFLVCNPRDYDGKGGTVALTRWIKKIEYEIENSRCAKNQKVKYATSSFINKALTWWNTQVQAKGREAAIGMSWVDFKALLMEEFCPSNKIEKLESEFWNHTMIGANYAGYTDRFHVLAKLFPHLVTPELKRIRRKEQVKPRRVRAMAMTIQFRVKRMILTAQSEAFKEENTPAERLHGLDQHTERKEDESLYFMDRIWVLLTKSTHFLATCEDYNMEKLARLYIDENVAWHGVLVLIISDRDGRFTSHFWQTLQKALGTRLDMSMAYHPQKDRQSERTIQTLEDMLRACVIDFGGSWDVYLPLAKFSYNNSYHSSIRCASFEALHKPLEFEVWDQVLLTVSHWKGVIRFGKKGKLAPREGQRTMILSVLLSLALVSGLMVVRAKNLEDYNEGDDISTKGKSLDISSNPIHEMVIITPEILRPDLLEAPEKAISAFQTVKGNSYVPHRPSTSSTADVADLYGVLFVLFASSALSLSPHSSCCLSYGLDPFCASEERFSLLKKLNGLLLAIKSTLTTRVDGLLGQHAILYDISWELKVAVPFPQASSSLNLKEEGVFAKSVAMLLSELECQAEECNCLIALSDLYVKSTSYSKQQTLLILGKLEAACEFFQGKGRPDSILLFTLIWSRPGECVVLSQGLENQLVAPLVEVSDPFFVAPPFFTLRHVDSPFVIRRGIRPRGISIGTSPLDFTRGISRHSPKAMGKDVDRSP
uniref:Reverse transcriptase domain-containing protein n=1 Tax=Tanacetum cinerariifolium TaxID=118510 RepID=A0A6L2K7V0_TANCI|nr:reverse transcriptase domain-containing protein [Tanacetum cinerariifolium]